MRSQEDISLASMVGFWHYPASPRTESWVGRMKGLSLQDVRQAVAGKSLTALQANGPLITAICTDSRRMLPFSLFVALRGDKFDGHGYLHDAARAGATAAIVDHMPDNPPEGMALIE